MSDDGTPGRITGLGGVFFKASDPAASLAWYQEKLGLVPAPDFPGSLFKWRAADSDTPGATVWALFDSDTQYFGPPGTSDHMVNYRVDDLDALLAKLEKAGVTILPQREDSEYLGRFAWIIDPDGHRIELWQPVPGK